MALIDRLLQRFGYLKASTAAPYWFSESAPSWTMPPLMLPQAQAELYQRLSWVHIAVSTVAQVAAGTALNIRQRRGEDSEDIENHPFEMLLQRPNPLQSRFELLEATFAYRRLTGNAYWWLNRTSETMPPQEIWLIPSHRIKPVPDGRMALRGYLYDPGSGRPEIPLETFEVCHFKAFHPFNPYIGLSPVEALATVAVGDMKMAEWNTNYFAKDNAKIPGFLAYADPINDSDWQRMKTDLKEQYGGTKRSLMMLRNVGKGGVEWVATAMSQKDMEFLAGRTMNREEIYGVFAPGLASMLAVNATEANSRTGKSTLMEMAVWPTLSTVAEKITNDVLPAYGDDLVAEFDDVRVADRWVELQEQAAYSRVHTIDEIRAKYYGDAPIGDERGNLLPTEATQAAKAEADSQAQAQEAEQRGMAQQGGQDNPQSDMAAMKADSPMQAELRTWQRFAEKRIKAGKSLREFETEAIPASLKAAITGALEAARTVDDVRRAFTDAQRWLEYP